MWLLCSTKRDPITIFLCSNCWVKRRSRSVFVKLTKWKWIIQSSTFNTVFIFLPIVCWFWEVKISTLHQHHFGLAFISNMSLQTYKGKTILCAFCMFFFYVETINVVALNTVVPTQSYRCYTNRFFVKSGQHLHRYISIGKE